VGERVNERCSNMPYPPELARVTLNWTPLASSWLGEEAVNTFWLQHHHFTGGSFSWPDAVQFAAEKVAEKLASAWTNLQAFHGQGYGITGVTVTEIDPSGAAQNQGSVDITDGSLQGDASGGILPPEVAIKLGLFSYTPGGFSQHKGRKRGGMYLPYVATSLCATDGKLKDAQAINLTTAWAAFFNDVQGMHTMAATDPIVDDYWDTGIASKVDGTWAQLNWVVCDTHFDSQRRRQHQSPAVVYKEAVSHS
jgi:hypothetical protein